MATPHAPPSAYSEPFVRPSPMPEGGLDALWYAGIDAVPLIYGLDGVTRPQIPGRGGARACIETPSIDCHQPMECFHHICMQQMLEGFSTEELRLKWIVEQGVEPTL